MELLHHRLAVLLVKVQSRLRRQTPFLGLRIIAVNLARGLQHEPAFLGKVRHLHKATPGMGGTVAHDDFQFLRQLRQVTRQGIAHLNGRRESLGPLGQHPGEILPRMLPPREEQHDPLPLPRSRHDAGGEQSRPFAGAGRF